MPLRKHSADMRDMYANAIAAALHKGETPSQAQIDAWAKYDAAAKSDHPAAVLASESAANS